MPGEVSSRQRLSEQSPGENSTAIEEPDLHNLEDQDRKEDGPPDWYVEGPGRRVGYDDLTAIDWIYEYAKERQRLRKLLALHPGFIGSLKQLLDASHVWVVLVASGISVGCLAACINIATDWLGDIKTGYCKKGSGGGQFYLNKQFCCWGHDEFAQCQDWTPWPVAMGIGAVAGQYIISYMFFIIFSVCAAEILTPKQQLIFVRDRFSSQFRRRCSSSTIPSTHDTAAYPRSRPSWAAL